VEKIEFNRPLVDASIRFLKKIARLEKIRLDLSTAHAILSDCNCDMRQALCQLQAILCKPLKIETVIDNKVPSSSLVNVSIEAPSLNSLIHSSIIEDSCHFHIDNYYKSIFYLDFLTKKLANNYLECTNLNETINFKKYDMFILRDGLTDNLTPQQQQQQQQQTSTSSGSTKTQQQDENQIVSTTLTTTTFNPFMATTNKVINVPYSLNIEDFSIYNSLIHRTILNDYFTSFMYYFNHQINDKRGNVLFRDWSKQGQINRFNFVANKSINRFAQATFKLTSNPALILDYRSYMQIISQIEEEKIASNLKRGGRR
jgi:hypothetical protein